MVQGLFESQQVEVSNEFASLMARRVLNSGRLLESLVHDADDGELYSFLQRQGSCINVKLELLSLQRGY